MNELGRHDIKKVRKPNTPSNKYNRHHYEFSKLISIIGISMWITVNIFGMVMMARTLDLSPLAYVIGSVDAVVSIVLSFYFWKAKAENQIKLDKIYGKNQYIDDENRGV